jgi:1-deoxy-D-xylulose-5-phosphate reductoisomerase
MEIGGTAPTVLNAADEIAVEAFLERRIGFTEIPDLIRSALDAHSSSAADSIEVVLEADLWARNYARSVALG